MTFDLALGTAVDVQPFDSVPAGKDGNIFDSTVSVLSVSLASLGYTDKHEAHDAVLSRGDDVAVRKPSRVSTARG